MTLSLDLLRHGETELGQCYLGSTDAALTARGWQQMRAGMAGRTPSQYQAILTSPLQRCAAFAHDWAGDRVCIEPRLAEYHFGRWDGRSVEAIHAAAPQALERFWRDPWNHPPPEAETLESLFLRLEELLEDLQRQYHSHESGPLLLICHGGVIRALHCILQGLPARAMHGYEAAHGSLHAFKLPAQAGR